MSTIYKLAPAFHPPLQYNQSQRRVRGPWLVYYDVTYQTINGLANAPC